MKQDPAVQCRAGDPDGMMRVGDGAIAACSSGPNNTPGKVITITTTAGDHSQGSLLWAYDAINSPSKIVYHRSLHGKRIELQEPLKWRKPYTTFDGSAADVEITTKCDATGCVPGDEAIVVGATHDVCFSNIRGAGDYNTTKPQMPANRLTILSVGDILPLSVSWDTEPPQRRMRRFIIDRATVSGCRDDCLANFGPVEDGTISRSYVYDGWHPSTVRYHRFVPPGDPFERLRLTYYANVWQDTGARTLRVGFGSRRITYVRNITNWKRWAAPDVQAPHAIKPIHPNGGLWLGDDAAGENDLFYAAGNIGVPGPGAAAKGGCHVGDNEGESCEEKGGHPRPWEYDVCNKKMVNTRWFFAPDNNWGGGRECVTNPPGYVPAPANVLNLDAKRSLATVLAEAGTVWRRANEQARLDALAASLPQ